MRSPIDDHVREIRRCLRWHPVLARRVAAEVADQLMIDVPGRGSGRMVPQTATMFSFRGAMIEFVADEKGDVTHLLVHVVERDFKGPRISPPTP